MRKIIVSLTVIIMLVLSVLGLNMLQKNNENKFNNTDISNNSDLSNNSGVLVECKEHKDLDKNLVCDNCEDPVFFDNLMKNQEIKSDVESGKETLTVSGRMPEDTKAEFEKINKEEAVNLAKQHIKDIKEEEVLFAYDISLNVNETKYQPKQHNNQVKVKLSELNLDTSKTYALLHIKENGEKELIPAKVLNANELEFKATSFSVYIVITVESKSVTFEGENYTIKDTEGNVIENGAQIASGTNFTFVVEPADGYAIDEITCVNSSNENVIEVTEMGALKSVKISEVSEDLTINVVTIEQVQTLAEGTSYLMQRDGTSTVIDSNGNEVNGYTYMLGAYRAGQTDSKYLSYTSDKVKTITFVNNINIPSDAEKWDVSYAKDGSIMAWIVPNTTDTTMYDMYIGSNSSMKLKSGISFFERYTNCIAINNLNLIDTSEITSMSCMFYYCIKLESLDITSFNTEKVTNMQYLFRHCESIETINAANLKTSNVTNMTSLFGVCNNVKTIDLSNWDASNIIDMSGMFSGFSNLTTLNLSGFKTEKVTNMQGMFKDCSSLTTVDVKGFNTANVTNMRDVFYNCGALTTLDVSGFNTENVTDMRGMFCLCKGLTELNVTNFNTNKVTNFSSIFNNCTNLTTIDIKNFDTSSAKVMALMFYNCTNLTSIDVSGFNFTGLDGTTSSDNLNGIKATDICGMFAGCSNLEEINVSNWNTSNITNMQSLFNNCLALKSLDLSRWDTKNVKSMRAMFSNAPMLEKVELNNWDTSNVTSMMGIFNKCNNLTYLDLSSWNISSITSVGDLKYFFRNCDKLETIILGKNFTRIDGVDMFTGCTNLKAIVAENSITASANAMILGESTGLNTLPEAILYVPNTASETAYEGNTTYATVFADSRDVTGADVDMYRIQTILGLYGNNPTFIGLNGTYDESATVAGYKSTTDTDITPTTMQTFGYALTQTSNNVNLASVGNYKVTYKLTLDGTTVDTVTRDVIVCLPILMEGSQTNSKLLGYSRYTGAFELTNVKRENILTITLLDTNVDTIPATYVASWDVSKNINGSVTAWLVQDTTDTTMYHLYIGGNGGVIASNGTFLFMNYTNCTAINNLNKLETSDITNMRQMFDNCNSLTSLDVSKFDTSNVTDMYLMFRGCNSLASLDVSKFNTAKVTSMSGMFADCSSLTSLDVSNFNTSNAISIGDMFSNCNNLTSLDVSNFNTAKVTGMGGIFADCSSLTSLDVSKFDTSKAQSMNSMFEGCSGLTSLDISTFDTSNVKNMECMFAYCEQLTSLDVSKFDTSNVEYMTSMFDGCSNLTFLDLSNFDTRNVDVGHGMFDMCYDASKLEIIILGQNFTIIGIGMFEGCTNLKAIITENPFTESSSAMTLIKTSGLMSLPEAILYVPNTTAETAYEGNTTYATVFADSRDVTGTDADMYRIQPILGLYGDDPTIVKVNGTYDEFATVAGYKSITDTDITPTTMQTFGYALTQTSNNVNLATPGKYQVTYELTLDGTTVDTATRDVTVEATIISNATIELSKTEYDYNGGEIKPTVSVTLDNKVLLNGIDYTVSYSNNINVGTATVTITGIGSYTETASKTFTIKLVDLTVNASNYTGSYDGEAHGITINVSGVTDVSDAVISYGTASGTYDKTTAPTYTNVGEYTIYFKIVANNYNTYTGSAKVIITAKELKEEDKEITAKLLETTFDYDGTAKEPSVTVTHTDKTLTLDKDYTIKYANNIDIGVATATVTGIGNYTGEIVLEFSIIGENVPTKLEVTAKVDNYEGEDYKPGTFVNRNVVIELASSIANGITSYEWSTKADSEFTSKNITIVDGKAKLRFEKEMNQMIYFRAKYNNDKYSEVSSINICIDKTAPKGSVEARAIFEKDGVKYTNSNTVIMDVTVTDNISTKEKIKVATVNEDEFIESNLNGNIDWLDFEEVKSWNTSEGDGLKKAYIIFKDEAGNQTMYAAN